MVEEYRVESSNMGLFGYIPANASTLSEVPRRELPAEQDNAQSAALSMRAFEGMCSSNSSLWVLKRFSFVIDGFQKRYDFER